MRGSLGLINDLSTRPDKPAAVPRRATRPRLDTAWQHCFLGSAGIRVCGQRTCRAVTFLDRRSLQAVRFQILNIGISVSGLMAAARTRQQDYQWQPGNTSAHGNIPVVRQLSQITPRKI